MTHEREQGILKTSPIHRVDGVETTAVLEMQKYLRLRENTPVVLHVDTTNPFGVSMIRPFGSIQLPTDQDVYAYNLTNIDGDPGILLALDSEELRAAKTKLEAARTTLGEQKDQPGLVTVSRAIEIYRTKTAITRYLGEQKDREKVLARKFLEQIDVPLPGDVHPKDINRVCLGIRTTTHLPQSVLRNS